MRRIIAVIALALGLVVGTPAIASAHPQPGIHDYCKSGWQTSCLVSERSFISDFGRTYVLRYQHANWFGVNDTHQVICTVIFGFSTRCEEV